MYMYNKYKPLHAHTQPHMYIDTYELFKKEVHKNEKEWMTHKGNANQIFISECSEIQIAASELLENIDQRV